MADASCRRCQLPIEDGAWQCDGCGLQFSTDIEAVRTRLQREAVASGRAIWTTLLVDVALAGGIVLLAMYGFFYFSVPLVATVIGSIGHAFHRRSVAREQLSEFTRRHPPLPAARIV